MIVNYDKIKGLTDKELTDIVKTCRENDNMFMVIIDSSYLREGSRDYLVGMGINGMSSNFVVCLKCLLLLK